MKLKRGVILAGLNPRMRRALIVANALWEGYNKELVITSGLDGAHLAGSFHYYGCAIDCRIRYFNANQLSMIMQGLKDALSDEFKIILESDHIHIQLKGLPCLT